MTNTQVYIWHDATGKIIAVGRPRRSPAGHILPVTTDETQGTLVLEVAEELVRTLHQTHQIDTKNRRLVAYEAQ